MAAMTTALEEFSNFGNSRVYSLSDHVAGRPSLVNQRRRVPTGSQTVLETVFEVVKTAVDSEGVVLPSKTVVEIRVKNHIDAVPADVAAAYAIGLEIAGSDEGYDAVATQNWLLP